MKQLAREKLNKQRKIWTTLTLCECMCEISKSEWERERKSEREKNRGMIFINVSLDVLLIFVRHSWWCGKICSECVNERLSSLSRSVFPHTTKCQDPY